MKRLALLLTLLLGACAAPAEGEDENLGSATSALSSSASFNNEDDHFEHVVNLPKGKFGIYDREGNLLATVHSKTGKGWIQGNERVESSKGSLYWLWGHKSGVNVSGYVRGEVIGGERGIQVRGEDGAANKNGRAAPTTGKQLKVTPTELPRAFRHATTKAGDTNAVDQYGVAPVNHDYAYMTWSTPWDAPNNRPLKGGGITRTLVLVGSTFTPAQVREIEMPAFDTAGKKIGVITWIYGYVRQNGKRVFGWMVKSHQATGETAIPHMEES